MSRHFYVQVLGGRESFGMQCLMFLTYNLDLDVTIFLVKVGQAVTILTAYREVILSSYLRQLTVFF